MLGFGILKNGDFLLQKQKTYYRVVSSKDLLISFLPFLEINANLIEEDFMSNNYDFYKIFPIEKIILTAFSGEGFNSFSIYWKELALNWIEDLKLNTPKIMKLLNEKSDRSYEGLPLNIKSRISKIKLQLLNS
ncbi:hypothetical protein [uncultured Chryseobacterium sp.]|uniref:hypothetical protein n=1 Tax=uncultured Chryseobacterium sp. TaxID=259322 RepID=UPI00258C521A|nr:hypothetical protein [uncultured Chryseobacterium sp.]